VEDILTPFLKIEVRKMKNWGQITVGAIDVKFMNG
jgi:hypothetical protein